MANRVKLRYTGNGSFVAHGRVTGRNYYFQRNGDVATVDARDVDGILKLGKFVKV